MMQIILKGIEMSASDAISIGAMIPAVIGGIALAVRMIYFAFQKEPTTLEEKEAVVYATLHERFRREGHRNPHKAASDRMGQHRQMEEFRRFACEQYVLTGKPLEEIRSEWWASRGKAIEEVAALGGTKADGVRYRQILSAALDQEDEDTLYVYQPAARRWADEKAKRDAEFERELRQPRRYDPVSAHTIEAMYAAKDRL